MLAVCAGGVTLLCALTSGSPRQNTVLEPRIDRVAQSIHEATSQVALVAVSSNVVLSPVENGAAEVVKPAPGIGEEGLDAPREAESDLWACPFATSTGSHVVRFATGEEVKPLRADGSRAEAEVVVSEPKLGPGTYTVHTYTVRPERPLQESTRLERWYIELYDDAEARLARSSTTRDIADDERAAVEVLGEPLTIAATTTALRARHAGYSSAEPAYVMPICVAFVEEQIDLNEAVVESTAVASIEEVEDVVVSEQPASVSAAAPSVASSIVGGAALMFAISLLGLSYFAEQGGQSDSR